MTWTLHRAKSVTAFLYSIRGTEAVRSLHKSMLALQSADNPAKGCRAIPERPNRFEYENSGYWVTFEVLAEKKIIRFLNISEVNK